MATTHQIDSLRGEQRLNINHLKSVFGDEVDTVAQAINSTSPRQVLFHLEVGNNTIPMCQCGVNALSWHPDNREYRKYCSKKCSGVFGKDAAVKTNLEKYGAEYHTKTDAFKEMMSKPKSSTWKETVKNVMTDRYGVDHVSKIPGVFDRIAETNMIRYGTKAPAQNATVLAKTAATNIRKYGVTCTLMVPEFKEKGQATVRSLYGADHQLQNQDILEKALATKRSRKYTTEAFANFNDPEWIAALNADGKTTQDIADILGVSASHVVKQFRKFDLTILKTKLTKLESKLSAAIELLGLTSIVGDRKILDGREIDILIPELNLGIEINGLYYHGEESGRLSNYHLSKTEMAMSKGITLWQYWDLELDDDRIFDILVSRIKARAGKSSVVYGRNTRVVELSKQEGKFFLESNHIQGDVPAMHYLGLQQNGETVACMSFTKSRFDKEIDWELARFCTKANSRVIGGASKLLTYFEKNIASAGETLVSYCDRRYSDGNVYDSLGFTLVRLNKPGYFYATNQGEYQGSRYKYQKHKLKDLLDYFNPELSEYENMRFNGYDKIWDCGQMVWVRTIAG